MGNNFEIPVETTLERIAAVGENLHSIVTQFHELGQCDDLQRPLCVRALHGLSEEIKSAHEE